MKNNNLNIDINNGENIAECEFKHIHQDIIETVRENMPEEDMLVDLAELFKVLGDQTRIKIIFILFKEEMCVCDIADLLDMTHSSISHQLRVLKQARLVKFRKEGKTVFYSLDDCHISQIFSCGLEHIEERYKR